MSVVLASEAASIASETLFVLAVIVILGPLLAEKLRLPGLIGFMLGGMVLGPFVLNVIEEGQFDSIGSLGVLYLMFLAGLELDMDIFNRYRKAAAQFGVVTFALPFAIGWWVAIQLDYGVATSVLIGSIWASHTLVSLPIVKRAGLSASRSVAVAAGATIITDTLALVVLGVVSAGVIGEEQSSTSVLVTLVVGLVALVFVTLWVYPRVGRWFFRGPGSDRTMRFMFLLGAMALGGFLSELAGIEGIVGAFFAGLGLNRLVPKRSNLMEKVEFFGSAFFIPAFLVSVGMLINPAVIFDIDTLLLAGAFLVVVVVGKGIAAVSGGLFFKFTGAENGLLFSLTVGQAAATLAAALVGVQIGLFDELILNAAVLAVLVTVLLASVFTRVFSRLVEPEQTLLRPLGASVVVPFALDRIDGPILKLAGMVAASNTGTVSPLVVVSSGALPLRVDEAGLKLEEAEAIATRSGAEAEGLVRVDSSTKAGVLNVVTERNASMIMISGGDGRRLQDVVFGGPMMSIGGASPVPTVIGFRVMEEPERLVVAIPGRQRAFGAQVDTHIAVDLANSLAPGLDVPVVALVGAGGVVPELPEGTRVKEHSFARPDEIRKVVTAGDLVIVPLSLTKRLIDRIGTRGRTRDGVGLLIAAGPYRLHTSGTDAEEVGSLLGYVAPP